jgi:ribosomal-protein-alanine N-acetyltransferase
MTELLTERLRLRRAQSDDLDAMHAVLSNPAAMRFWSTPPHSDREQTRVWLQSMIDSDADQGSDFVLEFEGRVIGKAGCWRVPAVGYILHPDYWSKGLAREALAAIIPHVFASFPIDAIEADVDPRNEASLGLLGRLGFAEVRRAKRTWLVGEEWCDSVYLELPRPAAIPAP